MFLVSTHQSPPSLSLRNIWGKVADETRSVLVSMFSLAQNDAQRDSIILTDSVIEHSAVVRYLLDIIHDLEVDTFADADTCLHAIDLADKWDMPDFRKVILQTLRGIFYENTEIGGDYFINFVVAIRLQEYKLASSIVKHSEMAWTGKPGNPISISDTTERTSPPIWKSCAEPHSKLDYAGTAKKDMFDMQYCSYRDALRLPPTVVWVLSRAATKSREEKGSFDRIFVAATFLKLMTEACKFTSPSSSNINDSADHVRPENC